MDFDLIVNILFATIRTGTPLILIALGEMVAEKSGVLNLGQEGMVLIGAASGFIAAVATGNAGFGIIAAIIAGMLVSLLFAILAISLVTNQYATGLALTIFGIGFKCLYWLLIMSAWPLMASPPGTYHCSAIFL